MEIIDYPNNQRKAIIIKEGNKPIFSDKTDINYYESQFSSKNFKNVAKSETFRPISIKKKNILKNGLFLL